MKLTRRTFASLFAGLFAAPVAAKVASAAVEPGGGGGNNAHVHTLSGSGRSHGDACIWIDSHGGIWEMEGPDQIARSVHLPKGHPFTIAHHAHPDKKP